MAENADQRIARAKGQLHRFVVQGKHIVARIGQANARPLLGIAGHGLQIGHKMIGPSAAAAVQGKGTIAPVPAFLQRQRRVGVVFFHRVAQQLCFRRQRGENAQRIQIAQQKIRRKPALPKPVVTAVCGDQQVAFGRCKAAGRKISRTDDITGLHGFGSLRSWVAPL